MSREAAHCRGGYYFCLDTKGSKKSSQSKCFFAAHGHCPANQAKPGLLYFYAAVATRLAFASVKICYALPLRKAVIVLPDFIRSCSTDGERNNNVMFSHIL
jgi:hypothetical protein